MKEPDDIGLACYQAVPSIMVPTKMLEQWRALLNRLACQTNLAAIELDNSRETPTPHLSSLAMETIGERLTQIVQEMEAIK